MVGTPTNPFLDIWVAEAVDGEKGDGHSSVANSNQNNTDENEGHEVVGSVKSISIPEFWDKCPQLWFVLAENYFILKNFKSDTTKYRCVLHALPQHIALTVSDIIKSGKNSYSELKEALIQRYTMSEEQRLNSLLNDANTAMGDRRPSDFYRHLEQLADSGTGVDKSLILSIWMRRLPRSLNVPLVASTSKDPMILIPMADRIWDTISKDSISAIQSYPASSQANPNTLNEPMLALCSGISEMCKELRSLRSEVGELKQNSFRGRSHTRNDSRSRPFDKSRSRSRNQRSEMCWYHYRFGENANKCLKPCSFKKTTDEGTPKNE